MSDSRIAATLPKSCLVHLRGRDRIVVHFRLLALTLCFVSFVAKTDPAWAAGGTDTVATKGQRAHVSPSWPEGVGELVNDPCRTSGWNSWFSEWPNDVNQYAFVIQSTGDLNRLIAKLAAIRTDLRQIRLSYRKEPDGLGWVTRLPKGNGIPVIFSMGDQSLIADWFKHLEEPIAPSGSIESLLAGTGIPKANQPERTFGQMKFVAAPTAVPPTLTIFVQNEAVLLEDLKIPKGVEVTAGEVPTVFHQSNTVREQQQEKAATNQKMPDNLETLKKKVDGASSAALDQIEQYLKTRHPRTQKRAAQR